METCLFICHSHISPDFFSVLYWSSCYWMFFRGVFRYVQVIWVFKICWGEYNKTHMSMVGFGRSGRCFFFLFSQSAMRKNFIFFFFSRIDKSCLDFTNNHQKMFERGTKVQAPCLKLEDLFLRVSGSPPLSFPVCIKFSSSIHLINYI